MTEPKTSKASKPKATKAPKKETAAPEKKTAAAAKKPVEKAPAKKTTVKKEAVNPAKKPVKKPAEKPAATATAEKSDSKAGMAIADNCVVSFHYRLCEIINGAKSAWLEQSFGREPLLYLHGHGNVITGLEEAMVGKRAGDEIAITLAPEQAYGPRRPNAVHRVPVKHLTLPKGQKRAVPGQIITLKTDKGAKSAVVVKAGKFTVDVDINHPFAGRTLHYEIQVQNVRPASMEEIAHRHAHGMGGHHH